MNKIIMNGHTYTESKDVEGEYILLVNNQKPTPLDFCKWADIQIYKLNNMTKNDLVDEYYSCIFSSSKSIHEMKVEIFKDNIKDKYNVDCTLGIDSFFFQSDIKSPFTKRKYKGDGRGGAIHDFCKYLLNHSELKYLF